MKVINRKKKVLLQWPWQVHYQQIPGLEYLFQVASTLLLSQPLTNN